MSLSSNFTLTNLDSATIPLTGRHLIEASAGTGKTYNITRIYLRLLLERELKVDEILLMTFTKDATQELRGRIDAFIRQALTNWHEMCKSDDYFKSINDRVSYEKIEFLLKRALLFLDEAAIFTIHGFCQRALTQHAFASGLPFNANMTTNSNELVLEAAQDWYRQFSKENSESFALLSLFWPTPNTFVSSFSKAITHRGKVAVIDVQKLVLNFVKLAKQANSSIAENTDLLAEGLIAHKKVEESEKRSNELCKLITWLTQVSNCHNDIELLNTLKQPMPDYLLNGNRHPKAFKVQLAQVLGDTKEIKNQVKNLAKNINKAKAYQLVRGAIYKIRAQVKQRKLQLNNLDFDDLINTLADALKTENGNELSQKLLSQYPVALVDEFQDTDPQQFSILQDVYYRNTTELANNGEPSALYLIGDPKQAIYGFRGGDIFAYLNARSDCDYHWLMDTNWRSSPDMINAYNQVFLHSNKAGDDSSVSQHASVFGYGIPYQAVLAGKDHCHNLNDNGDNHQALQFIHFTDGGDTQKINQSARAILAKWCANEIVNLLSHSKESENTNISPQDIAILVRDGREASDIKEALLEANLASVFLSDRANLFHSEQAKQLIQLLAGILDPENERTYLKALTCGLLGYTASSLYKLQQNESAYQTLKFKFFDYRQQWQRQGFIAMAINLMHQHFDFTSSAMHNIKARALTNLLHLFEILQSASQKLLQPQELLYWFEQQCNEESGALNELEAEQRLESDGDLIRIVTQHGAKGLEYPVVFIPFATRHKDPLKFGNKSISYIEYHDEEGQLCLSLDGEDKAKQAMANESYAESIRLLYVAITRAEHRCYILTTAFDKYESSPLGKTLNWPKEQDIAQSLQALVDVNTSSISLQQVSFDEIETKKITKTQYANSTKLKASIFIGRIERDWWLSSFSALSRNLRHGGISTPDRDSDQSNLVSSQNNKTLLRFQLVKGAHSGNLLHDILEHSNFKKSSDDESNLQESIKWPLVKYGDLPDGFCEADLESWLNQVVNTPLFSNKQQVDFRLCDIAIHKTLRESEFYFPMEQASVKGLEKLLTDHRNTADSVQRFKNIKLPNFKNLKGMMHGFIDLVFEHEGKYYVCDYKSSHLADDFNDYSDEALQINIENNYYDLQYLIYCLALHRYLKQNIENYNPDEHFGGIYYLYLRGMTDDSSHKGAGVYFRKITATELTELDNLFLGAQLEPKVDGVISE